MNEEILTALLLEKKHLKPPLYTAILGGVFTIVSIVGRVVEICEWKGILSPVQTH